MSEIGSRNKTGKDWRRERKRSLDSICVSIRTWRQPQLAPQLNNASLLFSFWLPNWLVEAPTLNRLMMHVMFQWQKETLQLCYQCPTLAIKGHWRACFPHQPTVLDSGLAWARSKFVLQTGTTNKQWCRFWLRSPTRPSGFAPPVPSVLAGAVLHTLVLSPACSSSLWQHVIVLWQNSHSISHYHNSAIIIIMIIKASLVFGFFLLITFSLSSAFQFFQPAPDIDSESNPHIDGSDLIGRNLTRWNAMRWTN